MNLSITAGTRIATVRAESVAPGTLALVVVDDTLSVALVREGETFYALDNRCPHRGASLAKGALDAGHIICPLHHFEFNLETGRCVLPRHLSIRKFTVRQEGEMLVVELPPPTPAQPATASADTTADR